MEDVSGAGSDSAQHTEQSSASRLLGGQQGSANDAERPMEDAGNSTDSQSQGTVPNTANASAEGTLSTHTSTTSLQSDNPPPYSLPDIDYQVRRVMELMQASPRAGDRGQVVSKKWLDRVLARTTENANSSEYPKEAREGEIGPIDNSDIVPEGAFDEPILHTKDNRSFIALKPGLTDTQEFQILPESAFGEVVGWYGLKQGQKQIERIAHNTADPPAENIVFELYPPVFTIRRVPHPSNVDDKSSNADKPVTGPESDKLLRMRGQTSPDDAIHLVSSRNERFHGFLLRAKGAAGIPKERKVKLWRLLQPQNVAVDAPRDDQQSMPSPPQSRSTSPNMAVKPTDSALVLPYSQFKEMQVGTHLEYIDAKDQTDNDNYNGKSPVELYGMFEDQTIVLEEQIGGPGGGDFESDGKRPKITLGKKTNGSKPSSAPGSGRTSPTPGSIATRGRTRRDGRTRGTVGLTNLGNTCYMNSALQCIRSVEELAVYFLRDRYKPEINTDNPLGHNGLMAKRYAELLQGIYADNASGSFTPSQFKKTLGNLQPLFSGYGQQDSQEFLSFLVDALHEDLNRIHKKPYLENPDSDDNTVHDPNAIIELGNTYRNNHRARNDSVAMDLFNGFYKNTMECPACDKVSVTFDPFSLVTLQLPIESSFQHTITYVPLRGAPINHAIDIDKNATIKMLKENIASKHAGASADRLWMVEVYNHKIYKLFENHHSLAEAGIQHNDHIFVFELDDVPTNVPEPSRKTLFGSSNVDRDVPGMESPKAERFAVPIFFRQPARHGWETIMHPLFVTLSREEAKNYDVILKKTLLAVAQITSRPILTEFDDNKAKADGELAANGTNQTSESATEAAAQVSDRSVPSEDGYVDVSMERSDGAEAATDEATVSGHSGRPKTNQVPAHFMDPQYFLSPALRNQLFAVNYAKSAEGAYCTGINSFDERRIGNMYDRVKVPSRRPSVQSSTSEASGTSSASAPVDESEESDADEDELGDKPDIVQGTVEENGQNDTGSDDDLPADPLDTQNQRGGRRRQPGKKDKFAKNRKGKPVTYSKKQRKAMNARQQRPNGNGSPQSQRSLTGKNVPQDDNPYYIKLGEAIVLDWSHEAIDSLFGGDTSEDGEMRGTWLSSSNGSKLEFVPDPVLEAKKRRRDARKKNGITLEDCFAESGKREILSEDNAWYCNRCKEMRQAAKTLEIWTIPDILIVHLKRFGGNRSFRDKVDVFVDYPIEGLDMTEKIGLKEDGKEYLYDLFAVDNHYGGLGGGHYTALAKNFHDGQWYDYNDAMCSKVGEGKVHSPAAYLLFYRRRSDKPLGPPELQELVEQYRNPPQADSSGEAEDNVEAGEGKLGGPTSSLHGSSSGSIAAGAGTSGNAPNTAAGGAAGAGNSLTTKQRVSQNNDYDPSVPSGSSHLQYGTSTWSFDALNQNQPDEADDRGTDRLLDNMNDDADSTMANQDLEDHDSALGDHDMNEYFDDWQDEPGGGPRGFTGANTPINDYEYSDDHSMYSSARMHQDDNALHLEDTGMIGSQAESPEAHEIRLNGDEMEGVTTHEKRE
ncbi:cysteine proteinase [Hortaea werneckii]|nr:cysteine proteinase [Hortaea werneckii]KAI6873305.1 cysteine proteinase [Hortaea werneckii]KAI7356945.1 cysteine proteinase [Hortaea werneckii]